MDIGFIGMGVMGRPMAANLVAAGHRLAVHRDTPAARAVLGPNVHYAASAAEAILEQAETVSATLLVIGLRPRTPVGKFIMGSSAQSVLLAADCPVLAVKAAH